MSTELINDRVCEPNTKKDFCQEKVLKGIEWSVAEAEWQSLYGAEGAVKGRHNGQDTVEVEVARRTTYCDRLSKSKKIKATETIIVFGKRIPESV